MPRKNPDERLAYNRELYSTNESLRQSVKDRKAESIARARAFVNELKQKPCTDCGNTYPTVCMDFDHLPGFVKVMGVARMANDGYGLVKIQAEIDKCELVCANCHRIRTASRQEGP